MIRKAFVVLPVLVALTAAVPALAQEEVVSGPSGNGPSFNAGLRMSAERGDDRVGMSRFDSGDSRHMRLSDSDRAALLENGRQMLRDIKHQIKNASSDEERAALLERKQAIENAMIEVQQMG